LVPDAPGGVGVSLADRVVEVIADFGPTAAPRYRYGSGCIVCGATVLTAAHVVARAVNVEVRDTRKQAWRAYADPGFVGDPNGPGPDLALLVIDSGAGFDLPPVNLAVMNRGSATGEPVTGCVAVGYPEFMEHAAADGTQVRETVGAAGYVPVLSGLAGGLLSLVVSNAPRPLPPAGLTLGASEWSGMSGAPLFAAGRLIGVVTEHASRQGSSTITATPLTALEHDPGRPLWGPGVANAPDWWRQLGVSAETGAEGLPRLPGARGRPRPHYLATVQAIHQRTPGLFGRDHEFDMLTAFSTGSDGYMWLVGEARAGKTSLLAEAVTTTLAATGKVDIVSYFLSRREADASSFRFLAAVVPQLAYLLEDESSAKDTHAFRHLWSRAAQRASARGLHLLLVVDALDDDTRPVGSPSVAALLPERAGNNVHVLVATRPDYDPLADLPPEHPLTRTTPIILEPYLEVGDLDSTELHARRRPDALELRDRPAVPSAQREKRVLIVDDRVADHLAQLLWECSCTVVHNLPEFTKYESRLEECDLALVDVHLTDSYLDHQGLEIVNRIVNAETDVLVLGMTMKPITGATRAWQRKHDLAELIQKSGDDETADFTSVIHEVRAALAAGPRGQLTQLLEDFHKVIEEARTKLLAKGRDSDLPLLKVEVGRIFDLQVDGSLAEVRGAIRDFRVRWNVQFPLG
jgi:Trypsin-like peptidase domain